MQISEMTMEEVEARLAEINSDIATRSDETELAELKAEVIELNERKAELEEFAKRQAIAQQLNDGSAEPQNIITRNEGKTMDKIEVRDSLEYGKAFLKGIKSDDYTEARALLTDAVENGQIPVPTLLDNEIRNAWEENQVLSLVKKTQYKGDVKVIFEVSATGAVIHVEGTTRPDEETLVLGSVTLKNANIKKWITISDEAIEGTTVDTVGYIYRELAQKIAEKAEEDIITNIVNAQETTDKTHPGVQALSQNPAVDTVLNAVALLSGAAKNLHLLMNRQTYPAFVKLALEAGYAIDVFDGLKDKTIFTDKLPAFSAASNGDTYFIVGDFGYGYQANMPNGNNITIKRDDISLSEYDLVKIVGKLYCGHGVVAPKAFTKGKKVTG